MKVKIDTTEQLIDFIKEFGTEESLMEMHALANSFLPTSQKIFPLWIKDHDNIKRLLHYISISHLPFDIKVFTKTLE